MSGSLDLRRLGELRLIIYHSAILWPLELDIRMCIMLLFYIDLTNKCSRAAVRLVAKFYLSPKMYALDELLSRGVFVLSLERPHVHPIPLSAPSFFVSCQSESRRSEQG